MTINATAATLLALYVAVADERGVAARQARAARSRTTSSRSTSRAARTSTRPRPSMRLITDTLRLLRARGAAAGTRSRISGYHIREAGCDAVQEVAFTLADGIAYVEAARRRRARRRRVRAAALVLLQRAQQPPRGGRQVPRRAAAVGADHARALRREGSASVADAALPRADRGLDAARRSSRSTTSCASTVQALAAVLGGAQSLHTNGYDEALGAADRGRRRGSRCARSRSSRTRAASPTSSIRSAAPTPSRRSPTEIERARRRVHRARSTSWAAWSPRSSRASRSARSSGAPTSTSARSRRSERIIVGVNEFATDARSRRRWPPDRPGARARAGRARARGARARATPAAHAARARARSTTPRAARDNLLPRDPRRRQGARHGRRDRRRAPGGVRRVSAGGVDPASAFVIRVFTVRTQVSLPL